MEATGGRESTELLDKILPPHLGDAGLEDCALPPDSIHEAFLKAAFAVKSRTDSLFHSDDVDEVEPGFVDDPFPDKGSSHPSAGSVKGYVKEAGCVREVVVEGKELVVVGGDGVEAVDVKNCLDDELKGLKIGEKKKKKNENQEDDEREKEKPILV